MQIIKTYSSNADFESDIQKYLNIGYKVVSMTSFPCYFYKDDYRSAAGYTNTTIVIIYEMPDNA